MEVVSVWKDALMPCCLLIVPVAALVSTGLAVQDAPSVSPAEIAAAIEQQASQYGDIQYSTIFNETKLANPFAREENPTKVSGRGRTEYARSGPLWSVDVHTFSVNSNTGDKFDRHVGGGFNGKLHWRRRRGDVILAEEFPGAVNHDPNQLFWHAARTRDWMLAALRREAAKVTGYADIDGHRCVRVESEFDGQRFRFAFAVECGWLPIESEYAREGKVHSKEKLSQLTQTDSGLWYPRRIRIENPVFPVPFEIKRLAIRDLRESDGQDTSIFEPPQAVGLNYVDRRTGQAWHNDPWWPDLKPILRKELDWPRADLQALDGMSSYGSKAGGRTAPEIAAAEWLNAKHPGWKAPGRRVTVVFFFGGRSIEPTPSRWASLKRLHAIYGSHGLDIVGITTPTTGTEAIRLCVSELEIGFPIAIDTKGERWGATYDAFGLQPYTGIFVVDSGGVLHTIDSRQNGYSKPSELEVLVRRLLTAAGAEGLPEVVPGEKHRLDDQNALVRREWQRLVRSSPQSGTLTGAVSSGYSDDGPVPVANAIVQLNPQIRLLISNNTAGSLIIRDRQRDLRTTTDATGRFHFADLAEGTYELRASADGKAFSSELITIQDDQEHSRDVELEGTHTIVGTVIGPDRLPVFDAIVTLAGRHPDPKQPSILVTSPPAPRQRLDNNGAFRFEQLQGGHYSLKITAEGYEEQTLRMVPLSRESVVVEMKLSSR